LDLANEAECVIGKLPLLDNISGETDKVRAERIDRPNEFRRVLRVTFVMEISKMNELAIPGALELHLADAQSRWLDQSPVDAQSCRRSERSDFQEVPASDRTH
jgi:hypothetical protein